MQHHDELAEAIEIIKGRYYLAFLKQPDALQRSAIAASSVCYCIDNELLYEPFYADFGPLNLGKTYRFCELTKRLLQEAEQQGKRLYLTTGPQQTHKSNAAVLVGIFQVLYLGRGADESYAPLRALQPFTPFRDASCGVPTFNLMPIDCIRGIQKARDLHFLDAANGVWNFDSDEYEHYEQVENGDLNWILPGKLLAFSGPAVRPTDYVGFRAMVPEDYWEYYKKTGISAIVRLNKKVYDRKRFLDGGFRHHELYFPDGSCPTEPILRRFLEIAEGEPGALAIHCKAGLGRTGVLICSYIMKHYRFTAEEVMGYIRICRPGSVIGPQQNFVKEIQGLMWQEGDQWRAIHGPMAPMPVWGPVRAAALAAAAAANSPLAAPRPGSSGGFFGSAAAAGARPGSVKRVSVGGMETDGPAEGTGLGLVARGLSAGTSRPPTVPRTVSGGLMGMSPAAGVSSADRAYSSGGGSSSSNLVGSGYLSGSTSSNGRLGGTTAAAAAAAASPYNTRKSAAAAGSRPGTSGAGGSNGPLTNGLIISSRPSTQQLLARLSGSGAASGAAVGSGSSGGGAAGRTPSAPRDRNITPAAGSLGGLMGGMISNVFNTRGADAAAGRPKAEGLTQSTDLLAGWRSNPSAGALGAPSAAAGSLAAASKPGTPAAGAQNKIARVLAPNGQPRKVPAAALLEAAKTGNASSLQSFYQ